MNCEVFIHVGIPKTGSTFLQKEVFPRLEGIDYYTKYPKLRRVIDDLPNASYYSDIDEIVSCIHACIEEEQIKRLLISNESLFGHPLHNYHNHHIIARILAKAFPEGNLLVMVRNQASFFESLYKYVVFLGYPMSKEQFFNQDSTGFGGWRYNGGINVNIKGLDYLQLLDVYESTGFKDRITIIPFEKLKNEREEVLHDVCGLLEVSAPQMSQTVDRNVGMSRRQIGFLRLVNGFFRSSISNGFGLIRRRPFRSYALRNMESSRLALIILYFSNLIDPRKLVQSRILKGKSSLVVLNDSERNYLRDYYSESNKKLAAKYNLDLEGFGYW